VLLPNFKGSPVGGKVVISGWVEKSRNFRPVSRNILEMVQDRSMVAMER